MKTLKTILITGSFLLAGCNGKNPNLLTEENFTNAEWVSVPYTGEIWTSYMGEEISRYGNWRIYRERVAEKNRFTYIERNDTSYIIGVKGKEIRVPDLDSSGFVVSGKDTVRFNKTQVKTNQNL